MFVTNPLTLPFHPYGLASPRTDSLWLKGEDATAPAAVVACAWGLPSLLRLP